MRNDNRGFSLVDILIALGIMGVLVAAVSPVLIQYIDKSKRSKDLEIAEELYNVTYLVLLEADKNDTVTSSKMILDAWDSDKSYTSGSNKKYSTMWHMTEGDEDYYLTPVLWQRGTTRLVGGRQENTNFDWVVVENYQQDFKDAFVAELLQTKNKNDKLNNIKLRSHKVPAGKKSTSGQSVNIVDTWYICKNNTTGNPEIWVGRKWNSSDKSTIGNKNDPVFRLYPNPDPYYAK
ncbi:MAG: type II secretion system protein [Lachnospiraceae bacterium]|nr:type II secretion system protein [Lachnospiraceae bacterium]